MNYNGTRSKKKNPVIFNRIYNLLQNIKRNNRKLRKKKTLKYPQFEVKIND